MMFVRYLDTNDYMEQFLFCRRLAKNTTGEQIFKKVDSFFKQHQLEWSDCVSVCEDDATSMMGCKKGFMSFVKKENKNISVVHCLIYRENLTAKEIQGDLAIVFEEVVSVVNFIKSRPLHTRLFRVLCNEMGAEHNGLLFHFNIRWVSRGKVMERVANLRNEISIFLKEQKHRFFDRFSDRRRRLKGIHSRSDTNRTGAEGLSFYCPRLLHCLDQMLAVMSLSQHRVCHPKPSDLVLHVVPDV